MPDAAAPERVAVRAAGALYRWRATERGTGRVRSGEQVGDSPQAVRAALRRLGLDVTDIAPVAIGGRLPAAWASWWHARRRRARRHAIGDLCDALATLLLAGLPLDLALESLAGSSARDLPTRRMLRRLRDGVRGGAPLSTAVAAEPGWFDRFDVAVLDAGQHAGDLPAALHGLAQHHQRAGAVGQRLGAALIYPAILLAAGIAALEFMSFQTLPQLVAMLAESGQEPPALTSAVMALGQGLAWWWPVPVVGGVTLWWLVRRAALRGDSGAWAVRLIHRNPLWRWRAQVRVAQLALALHRLTRAGMPLAEALDVVVAGGSDPALCAVLARAAAGIRRGEDFSALVAGSPLLDPECAQLLHLGERSGELPAMLERMADRYQRAADRGAERVSAWLGPVAIAVLACMLGLLVFAAVLPLARIGGAL